MLQTDKSDRAETLTGRKKEIWDMAVLMADEKIPTERDVALELSHAKDVVNGIDEVMGWVVGKNPRPNRKPFKEWISEWKQIARDVEAEEKTHERS